MPLSPSIRLARAETDEGASAPVRPAASRPRVWAAAAFLDFFGARGARFFLAVGIWIAEIVGRRADLCESGLGRRRLARTHHSTFIVASHHAFSYFPASIR